MNRLPKITKGNDFKLSLHMTETMCNDSVADLEGTITSVNLVSSNGSKISVQEGDEENGKIKYHNIGDSTIIIAILNPLPLGKYGVEVNGTRNIDNSDFRYFNDYVFEIVKTTADGFIPCNSTMTYSIVGANVGLATSIESTVEPMEQVQSDWEQTDSTKVDYIKNKPNVYEKPNGGIPKTDLTSDVQETLDKADTAIQSEDIANIASMLTTAENGAYFTNESGEVFLKYDNNGLDANKVSDHFKTLVGSEITIDQVLTSGSTNAVSSKAVYQWVNNQGYLKTHQSLDGYATQQWVTNQGYLTQHQDISGKEDKIGITVYSASTSSIQLQMNYNRVDFAVGTMAFTLPTVTSSDYLQGLIVSFTTDTTPSVTVTSTDTVIYADGSDLTEIEASTPYELNAIWDGVKWKITLTKFIAA